MLLAIHMTSAKVLDAGDDISPLLMEIQGKYTVGATPWVQSSSALMYRQTYDTLNLGTVAQRLRFVVLAAELQGPREAAAVLDDLETKIEDEQQRRSAQGDDARSLLTKDQSTVISTLRFIYDIDDIDDGGWAETRARIEALSDDERALLKDQLGWFGKLALAPPGDDDTAARNEIIASTNIVFATVITAAILIGGLGLCGFIGLTIFFVLVFNGRVHSSVAPGGAHHGLYAETFGIWMVLFPIGQLIAGALAIIAPAFAMPMLLAVFFGSLVVLAWPVLRGARWADVRADIGWTLGRQPALEPIFGVTGYAMALPMLGIGLCLTLLLILLQGMLAPPLSPFDPAGGPAHPIVLELAGPSIWPKLMILLLAAVAAPVVEETMFRGVLYRHLRDASRHIGHAASILVSAAVSGFIFAAVHPQGWVAIPALMSLSFGFVLVREWRGTLIPAMLIHGISNFLVMTILIIVLTA